MADVVKPVTRVEYFVITTDKFPSYEEKIKYKRYLRRSVETPTLASGEEMVKVAITTYPNNEPYELNTDPINLSGWDPTGKTWASCQDWLFYDDVNARNYVDPEGLVNDAKIGGFMKLEPTYFYYNSENKYQGSGTWNDRGSNTAILTPPLVDGKIADPNKYDITWNGTDAWVIVKLPEKIIGYPEFTFVVDSDEHLADWANNASGNDYMSVLIRKGTYNINNITTNKKSIVNLHQTGTLLVMFEVGAKIIASDSVRVANSINYIFEFNPDTFPTNINEYPVIYNANVEFSSKGVGVGFSRHCINYNCQCVLTSSNTTGFWGVCAFDGEHSEAVNCTAETDSNYQIKYLTRHAKKVFECYSSTMTIYDSYRVRDCICARYSNSYSSPTAITGYECANTLNGGWNQ